MNCFLPPVGDATREDPGGFSKREPAPARNPRSFLLRLPSFAGPANGQWPGEFVGPGSSMRVALSCLPSPFFMRNRGKFPDSWIRAYLRCMVHMWRRPVFMQLRLILARLTFDSLARYRMVTHNRGESG